MTVVKLTDTLLPGELDAAVVDDLRDCAERAERGEILGFAIVEVLPNQCINTNWAGSGVHRSDMLAGLAVLQQRLVDNFRGRD